MKKLATVFVAIVALAFVACAKKATPDEVKKAYAKLVELQKAANPAPAVEDPAVKINGDFAQKLQALQTAKLTPEEAYLNYTFQHRDFARTADSGVGLITVDLWMLEVVETATAQYQNTQQPGDAGQQGSGQTTATSVSSAVSQQYFNAGGAR